MGMMVWMFFPRGRKEGCQRLHHLSMGLDVNLRWMSSHAGGPRWRAMKRMQVRRNIVAIQGRMFSPSSGEKTRKEGNCSGGEIYGETTVDSYKKLVESLKKRAQFSHES